MSVEGCLGLPVAVVACRGLLDVCEVQVSCHTPWLAAHSTINNILFFITLFPSLLPELTAGPVLFTRYVIPSPVL